MTENTNANPAAAGAASGADEGDLTGKKVNYNSNPSVSEGTAQDAADGAHNAHLIHVTFFPDQAAQDLSVKKMTLEDLRDLIVKTTASEKDRLPFLKLAKFGEARTEKNCLRNNANVTDIGGIELDYDDKKMSFEDAIAKAKEARVYSMLYTSSSYTKDKPKWRILCPTSRELPTDERTKLVARVNGLYGGIFAGESFTLSQAFYFGKVNDNPEHRALIVEGDFIDLRDDLDEGALGKSGKPKGNGRDDIDDAEYVEDIRTGAVYHTSLVALSARWIGRGTSAEEVAKKLGELLEQSAGPRDQRWHNAVGSIERIVQSAVEKFPPKADAPKLPPEVYRLAGLSPIEYERERVSAADSLGMRVSVLDQLVAGLRPKKQDDEAQGQRLELPDIEPWTEAVDGSQLIADMAAIRKHIVINEHQALAISLWIIHAHLLDCACHSARLHIASPAPRCGKSVLLSIIEKLVPRAISAENVSTAAMFRLIEMVKPTLLIDEVDSFLNSENRDDLRGLLNAGHTPSGTVIRVVGDDFEPRGFRVWAAVVLAGIGQIPATIEDRSITINMRRRLPSEKIERLRKDAITQLKAIGRRVARWAADNRVSLFDADPPLPEELNDRARVNWRLPIAIADCISGDLGKKAREAAKALDKENVAEPSNAILALADVAAIFADKSVPWMPSADLVRAMTDLEGRPWKDWNRRAGLTQNALARLLKPFHIRTRKDRSQADKKPVQGYDREPIEKAAQRYDEGIEKAEEESPF